MTSEDYRKKCFEHHGTICIRCLGGRPNSGKVIAHHIDGDRENHSVENLAPICNSCHQLWHKNKSEFHSFEDFVRSYPWERSEVGDQWFPDGLLLTPREREILTGEADVSEKYYYRVVTRVRDKIGKLGEDLEVLEEHDTLADELRDEVCDE